MGWISHTERGDHPIAVLAERQRGVVSRSQLRELGLSDRTIERRVEAGRLHPIFRGVYAVGHRRLGRLGRMLAAMLACGDGALVSHRSAAELFGLWDKKPVLIDVVTPGQAGRKMDGIRWHRAAWLEPDEVATREGIACTTSSRTLVDLAGSFGEGTLRRLVEQAAVLRLLDVVEVDRVLARGRRRGAAQLRRILVPWHGEAEGPPRLRSILEARFFPLLAEADLPRPQCNVRLAIGGDRLEVDMLWQEHRLVLEADGEETHGTRVAFQEDRRRGQILVAAGYRTAQVTWCQLEEEPASVVARVRRMLEH